MKGFNKLVLNEATMIEAVQLWVDRTYVERGPLVTCITSKSDAYSKTFTISLDSDTERPVYNERSE